MKDDDVNALTGVLEGVGQAEPSRNRPHGWDAVYRDDSPWWGLPRVWESEAAQELVDDLTGIWRAQMGRLPGDAEADLWSLDIYFNPLAAGRRLRPALADLPVTHRRSPHSTEPLVLVVGDSQHLVTPEGRLFLDAISAQLKDRVRSTIRLTLGDYQHAQIQLLGLYRSWSRRRLRDVLRLQSSVDAPKFLPQSLGVILLLLVNGNTSSERPLSRPSDPADLALVDAKTQDAIAAFADTISPPRARRRRDQYSLYRGYALTEARRRLGSQRLVVKGNDIFIAENAAKESLDRVVSDLRRREVSADLARRSFDALLDAYRAARPILAAYGLAYERPSATSSIRESLVRGLASADSLSSSAGGDELDEHEGNNRRQSPTAAVPTDQSCNDE
jgi:hypothetical protein